MKIEPSEIYAAFIGPIFRKNSDNVPEPSSLRTAEVIKIEDLDYFKDEHGKRFFVDIIFPNGDKDRVETKQPAGRENLIVFPGTDLLTESGQAPLLEGADIDKEFIFEI